MASVQSQRQLAKDAPDKALLRMLSRALEVVNHLPQVSVAAILHIQVQILAALEMLSMVVSDDVGVSKRR